MMIQMDQNQDYLEISRLPARDQLLVPTLVHAVTIRTNVPMARTAAWLLWLHVGDSWAENLLSVVIYFCIRTFQK